MRRLLILGAALVSTGAALLVAGATGAAPTVGAQSIGPGAAERCKPPSGTVWFGGRAYRRVSLRTTAVPVGRRVGEVSILGCNDVCVPDVPCNPTPVERFGVHRIRRVSPRVAVSLDGIPTELLVAGSRCARRTERVLVACLRRASR